MTFARGSRLAALAMAGCFVHVSNPAAAAGPAPRHHSSPFPVSSEPAEVWLLNTTDFEYDQRILSQALAGLVAQTNPLLFLSDNSEGAGPGPSGGGAGHMADFLLSLMPLEPSNVHLELQHNLSQLLLKFRSAYKGYILYTTPGPAGSDNGPVHVACSLAGVLQGLPVTVETLKLLSGIQLPMLANASNISLEDAFDMYENDFSKGLLLNQQVSNMAHTLDYAVYAKAFTLYDSELSMPFSQRLLKRMKPISMVLGWASEVNFVTSASRFGHQVLCSDAVMNLPFFSNFAPPSISNKVKAKSGEQREEDEEVASCSSSGDKHSVAFMFTDGDSLTWDMGNFASSAYDWWGSQRRGKAPIAWTFQPVLVELNPYFLSWVLHNATKNDKLLAGPSGAGYTYLDQYPSSEARQRFAEWTSAMLDQSGLLPMINQIQNGVYDPAFEQETVHTTKPPAALFIDEYFKLTLKGKALLLNQTVITARRHALSKTFGDVTPQTLIATLNQAPTDPNNEDGYSLVGVEVWGYGVDDIVQIVEGLDKDRVQVLDIEQYVACLRKRVLS